MMTRTTVNAIAVVLLAGGLALGLRAQQAGTVADNRIELGPLGTGAAVAFVRADSGEWGMEISGSTAPRLTQPKPAQIEVYVGADNVRRLAAGYQSVRKDADTVVANAKVGSEGPASFAVEDRWKTVGAVLSLSRTVSVIDAEDGAGFFSAIRFSTAPTVRWEDVNCLAPGLLYGDASHAGGNVPTSMANYRAKRFNVREDYLSAPLFGVSFKDGSWAAVLDPAPRGDTTQAETTASAATPIVDERIQFGALGAREIEGGRIELGFWLPGTTNEIGGGGRRGGGGGAAPAPVVRRRYHPVKAGFKQSYQVAFSLGKSDSLRDMERDTWRWAWATLNPKVTPIDVEVARRTLIDHLSDRVLTVEDRTGVPFEIDSVTGRPSNLGQKIIMGFCGKNLEAADLLLREGDRDPGPRGQKMRQQGLAIIASLIRIVPMSPPAGVGFNIQTGLPVPANFVPGFTLRMPSEDLAVLIDTYRREKQTGRDHPEWLKWITAYSDWLLTQQREDGSFPSIWEVSTGKVLNDSGTTSYVPVPLLVKLSAATNEKKYLASAIKAADYIWTNFGSKGIFLGATGNANVADKESGMLSLEAFLALFDHTGETKWLDRARFAADYSETWIWIWNVPMPADADDAKLHWKKGVPTVGVQGIGSDVAGHVDQYLDWSVPSYAKLYELTKDEHYLDVARILLHNTKAMLALPGRTYDLLGPGWHQEHFRMGPGTRGMGAHRNWLVWVSANHLHGITGLEEFDQTLYQQLSNQELSQR